MTSAEDGTPQLQVCYLCSGSGEIVEGDPHCGYETPQRCHMCDGTGYLKIALLDAEGVKP